MTEYEIPELRIRQLNQQPERADGTHVVYWMTASRRLHWNFSLQRAVSHSLRLGRPLIILEAVRCDYRWASDRLHAFILQGMQENRHRASSYSNVLLHSYVEPASSHGSGLLQTLAERACVVVTDDFPCFFLPRMIRGAAAQMSVAVEAVDSNGLLPLQATDQVFPTAYAFRRWLQKNLAPWLSNLPVADPLLALNQRQFPSFDANLLKRLNERWPEADEELLEAKAAALQRLPIDHSVGAGIQTGGTAAAERQLSHFLSQGLKRYGEERSQPDSDASSNLSGWLHFGHLSVHEIFARVAAIESWCPEQLADAKETRGSRAGWWGMSSAAESFLDELITWREIGFNFCSHRRDYDQYSSLPNWAKTTLAEHAGDPRPTLYSLDELQAADTHDEIWNAAQTELLRTGRMHNYLRMLWGKKILEWSATPEAALECMIELNNRFAVDGRNPNSYSGIFWVLGRYDRAWGPERPIFGKIRYMSSDNTLRKLQMTDYLQKFGHSSPRRGRARQLFPE
ncbi:MAG: deoxyribodipyrimidine photolyase [Planctomycetaceae bacterium]|nr:deoxyribodipyrimidine photolyase [Planctomycetaceae bacterium]